MDYEPDSSLYLSDEQIAHLKVKHNIDSFVVDTPLCFDVYNKKIKTDDEIVNPGLAGEEIKLGHDEYFVLGDNYNNSEDSRFSSIGNVREEDIIGKVWLRVAPFARIGIV